MWLTGRKCCLIIILPRQDPLSADGVPFRTAWRNNQKFQLCRKSVVKNFNYSFKSVEKGKSKEKATISNKLLPLSILYQFLIICNRNKIIVYNYQFQSLKSFCFSQKIHKKTWIKIENKKKKILRKRTGNVCFFWIPARLYSVFHLIFSGFGRMERGL